MSDDATRERPGQQALTMLARRLAAIGYDTLLVAAVLFLATTIAVALNGGEAITPGNGLYLAYLLACCFVYFAWFWTHGGHTLGMRAWGLRIERTAGGLPSWTQAATRFFAAILSVVCGGLGFAWILIDQDARGWHDRLSKTRIYAHNAGRARGAP